MSRIFKWNMLVNSFIPLWVSVLFLLIWDIFSNKYCSFLNLFETEMFEIILAVVIIFMIFISTISIVLFFKRKQKTNENSGNGKIISASKSETLITDFLLTYIMPMIAFDLTEVRDVILFCVYFALIAFLNIRNGSVYTNILFKFMGYRVYICNVERNVAGETHIYTDSRVISREKLTGLIGKDFSFFDFDNDIYLNLNN